MSKWPMVKLGDILQPAPKILAGEIEAPILSITMHNGLVEQDGRFKKRIASTNTSTYRIVKRGQLVVGFPIDEGVLDFQEKYDSALVSPAYGIWNLVNNDVLPDFIGRYLRSPHAIATYKSRLQGTTARRRSLPTKVFQDIEVPLPPLGEQKRIAEILGRVNYAIQSLDSQIQFIESLPNKIFEFFFNKEDRQGKRPSSTIANFISNTQYGTSKKAAESGAIPILRMGNITYSGQIDRSDLKYIDLTDKEIDKYTLQDGDLLFNRTNSVELVGKTAVFEENLDQKVSYAGYLIRARTNADSNPYYVSGYLNSPGGKAQLRLRAKSIVGMANINATEFLSLRVPAATKSEQDDFAHFYLECKSSRKLLSQKLALLQELQRSLSARAFAGQL